MLNLNKYTPLFMKMFLPILMRASYTRIHIDRNLYMWVFLKLRGQKSTLFGTSTKSSTFLRQTLLIKCRQPQNTSSKIYLSMYTFVKKILTAILRSFYCFLLPKQWKPVNVTVFAGNLPRWGHELNGKTRERTNAA